jgi:hypothetical protein
MSYRTCVGYISGHDSGLGECSKESLLVLSTEAEQYLYSGAVVVVIPSKGALPAEGH